MHDPLPTQEYLDMLRRLAGDQSTATPSQGFGGPSPINRKKRRAERARLRKARR